jgi:dihydrofolate reductase
VARAKSAAGDRDVCVFGASTAAQCLEAGLIDELLVQVAPLLLGEGVRLFECGAARPVRLEKLAASESGPLTNLRFRVLQEPAQN